MKLESALSVASRKFLNRFPIVLTAKSAGRKMQDSKKTRAILTRVLDAALRQRRVSMRYDSRASGRTKDYKVDPLRLSYADGGIYLIAWVEEYGQVRTFATERIRTLAVTGRALRFAGADDGAVRELDRRALREPVDQAGARRD